MKLASMLAGSILFGTAGIAKPPEPVMTDFYTKCMKAGGVPGSVWQEKVLYYKGPQYFFSIWTPDVENAGQLTLNVEYANLYRIPPPPTPRNATVSVKLEPGQSTTFATDEIYLGRSPRGTDQMTIEYCIKVSPVINLENIGSLTSIGLLSQEQVK